MHELTEKIMPQLYSEPAIKEADRIIRQYLTEKTEKIVKVAIEPFVNYKKDKLFCITCKQEMPEPKSLAEVLWDASTETGPPYPYSEVDRSAKPAWERMAQAAEKHLRENK